MQRVGLRSEAGVSLVELMVVVLIISIAASLAFMNRGSANEQLQRQNAARQLKAALERARFDSVKRRAVNEVAKANVVVSGNSFTLNTDVNLNGVTTDPGDAFVTTLPTGITLQRYDGAAINGSNNRIAFNMRGEVAMSPPPQFIICNGTCPAVASLNSAIADVLIVTPTGTVNLLPGGPDVIPDFNNPVLAGSTSATDGINPEVTVP